MSNIFPTQLQGNNLEALTNPGVSDDITQGRQVGSVWINRSASPHSVYVCTDNSTGAAVWVEISNNNVTGGITTNVNQVGHGFLLGEALQMNAGVWARAQASAPDTLGVGIVKSVVDADNFVVSMGGLVTGLSGLTAGEYYFVSDSVAGALVTTEPTQYSNPIGLAVSSTEMVVLPYRPSVSSSGAVSLPNYSTSEVDTLQKWVDGRTIWRKIVNFGTLPNTGTKSVAHGITGLDFIVQSYIAAKKTSGGTLYRILSDGSLTTGWSSGADLYIDNTNVNVGTGGDWSTYTGFWVLEYVKV